ncbi:DHS-like NAD/FAD-binding domain-containing protein [Pseudoneurospora amorphoporcata]|uniref:protein acetyllysine N-acetyltransferase n=1 Tax=Pseudoneurospora amorphoporcata TaxID=241081 RepID=A0AAN6NQU7_9PEZI|nr:DHS-like NAD/FAD-binding domain-containing protein [Pseudoneurospora amorphoporcata]
MVVAIGLARMEKFEAPEVIDRKARVLAELIRKSKHLVVFTGASISTSAGIPDFRDPEGIWTLVAHGQQATKKLVDNLQAIPTKTHMALVELQGRGILKGLISQNCDGLHRRIGIRADMISELHANTNIGYCNQCYKEFLRAGFYAVAPDNRPLHDHRTGRKYPICITQSLHDTIIHFSEDKADLCLVLGSSLIVTPANELLQLVGERAAAHRKDRGKQHVTTNLVICNLQDTDLDHLCLVPNHRIFAKADDLMQRVIHHLQLPIPEFRAVPVAISASEVLSLSLEFMGNYGEPICELQHTVRASNLPSCAAAKQPRVVTRTAYQLIYDPCNGKWTVELHTSSQ